MKTNDRTENNERTIVQRAMLTMAGRRAENIPSIGKTQIEHGPGNADGKHPNGKNGQEGFPFAPFATAERPRNVKKTIDRDDGQMPDRSRTEKHIEENIDIAEQHGQLPRALKVFDDRQGQND